MKVSVLTLGCKVNQYESQVLLNRLQSAGFTVCDSLQESDIVVLNTCTVTSMSDRKARQMLHRARRDNPGAVLVVTGCLPQAFPQAVENELAEADIVLGNSNRSSLLPDLQKYLMDRQRIIDIVPHKRGEKFEPMNTNRFFERTRAFLKIEDGCNRYCSYCIIPYARGAVRSKPMEELKNELEQIAAGGYREVVLTGINLSAYGQELGLTLCDAVEAACAVEGIRRVRLGSLEPERLDESVIARLKRQEKLCPQFHLSLQSGCDETLKRMNRHYDTEEYRRIVRNLRKEFANSAITTDIMVGFPGETEEEFESSKMFLKEIGFAKAHVFAYSRRPGTVADRAPDQVDPKVKEDRSKRMIEAARETRSAFLQSQCGLTESVLFERKCSAGVYEGYTSNYTPVRMHCAEDLCGKILTVRITETTQDFCLAEAAEPVQGERPKASTTF
ncbi:Threonylcarbamoyladenosine tRNA methylthiotransferase MtaB [Caprobacter fermentans]|uniref:Threonylcarbamoyladenosine tRNA methylthiotransferase MtaB n=1 Tax=Caproicibacter fermentans TaxID=2576756 RepID=A0A6N8I201_9FIRM|nr:tRNA (N(6)-L-threonylcarbamoyladenosine(37)-C(2))-methylthiotransferase MtaB [Caproicibacter fermentans]MVB11905.1 Threonylcarbamoyladenosine tRNA methylthiotransferase MtaB [Caproicibacter fermentans]OCM99860.1 tRNA (N(6)-L-threonylcarbamoyladenosine(37)-C(2))-methylthiotransferase MtaB [Clostridium sp. W14A]